MKRFSLSWLAALTLFVAASVNAATVPTIHQVYEAAHSGHLVLAQQMMHRVLAVHPNSSKAHFVLADILAAEHQFSEARQQLQTAEHLAPGLPFEKAQAVQLLQARIERGLAGHYRRETGHHSYVVILLGIACLVLLMVVIRAMRMQRAMPVNYNSNIPPNGMNPMGNMTGAPYSPMSPMGSGGFMSSLKTGLGIGAGMAAGEAVVNHLLDGQNNTNSVNPMADMQTGSGFGDTDLGGNDFGMNDADAGWGDDAGSGDFSDFGGDDGGGWN